MLLIEKLRVDYGNFNINIEDVDFDPGIHVLIGENGSGKSSILTGITGYNPPVIKDRALKMNNHALERTADYISYLPQQNLPFQISVIEFIQMTSTKSKSQKIVNDTLKRFNLLDYKHTSIEKLSGGEFKRALCAQLHLEDKPVMMFDEIEQGLDINYQHMVMEWLKTLSKDKVILIAMHDVNLALSYADTVTCMKKGTITEVKVPVNNINEKMLSETFSREMEIVHHNGKIIALS